MGRNNFVRAVSAILVAVLLIAAALTLTSPLERTAADQGYRRALTAQGLLTAMLDRETGLRGFLLAGRQVFLAPYRSGTAHFAAALASAERDVRSVGAARPALARQAAIASQWQRLAVATIASVDRVGPGHVSVGVLLDRKALMDAFRAANASYAKVMNDRRQSDLTRATRITTAVLIAVSVLLVLGGVVLVRTLRVRETRRRLELREVELRRDEQEREYVEARRQFSELVQVSESEVEAAAILAGHVQVGLAGADAVVLRRNASADRLEPVTPLREDSRLQPQLEDATPRSCLAMRLGRPHESLPEESNVVRCEVCGSSEVATSCEPLLVGGELIGALLVGHPSAPDGRSRRLISETVSSAAPVLANLRNLAVAERRAHTDALTGLANRRALDDTLKLLLAQASRAGSPLSMVLFDLDHFKLINDTYGHDGGDRVLAALGALVRDTTRASDFAGRLGGEEFVLLLSSTDTSGAGLVAEKLRHALAEMPVPDVEVSVTASFGISGYPLDGVDPETLTRAADRALYQAKRDGRDCIRIAAHDRPQVAQSSIDEARTGEPPVG